MTRTAGSRTWTWLAGLLTVLVALPGTGLEAQEDGGACGDPSFREFDFWIGEWDVLNRQRRPDGTAWGVTGQATDRVYPVVDGCGIVEHWRGDAGQGFVVGYSLRAWNPDSGRWDLVLLWPPPEQPVFFTLEGGFRHGRGEFFASRTDADGNEVLTRFTFADVSPVSLRWNNGTSRDGGNSWATTWIMEFSRRDSLADPLLNGPTQSGERCTFPEIRQMDAWLGEWEGEAVTAEADTVPARARSYEILDGCGFMDFVELGPRGDGMEVYRVRTYEPGAGHWVEYRLDSRHRRIERLEGEVDGEEALLVSPSESGEPGRRVRTRWTRLARDGVRFETAVSTAGAPWTPLWTVSLRPKGR